MRCGDCKFYQPLTNGHLGDCSKWHSGYHWDIADIKANEVVVESDEGWGAYMGPDFGCVLFEAKP